MAKVRVFTSFDFDNWGRLRKRTIMISQAVSPAGLFTPVIRDYRV